MSCIELTGLTRNYGHRRGVERLSLSIPEGALFGFLGPNGAGKTTAIRVLLGFLRPTSGSARIFGLDCWHQSKAIKRDVGYMPGDLRLPAWMNLTSALAIFGAVRGRDLARAGSQLAERFELDARVAVRDMSRGMRQKLGLVLALAHAPRLLVLDEPTSSLDPLMQQVLHQFLRETAEGGRTVFFSSHSLSEVEQLCDAVAVLREGQLVAHESLAALRQRAGYDVFIRWKEGATGAPAEPPEFLKLTRKELLAWHGVLDGSVQRLVDFLAGKPVEELTIQRPDLESLFQRYYTSR